MIHYGMDIMPYIHANVYKKINDITNNSDRHLLIVRFRILSGTVGTCFKRVMLHPLWRHICFILHKTCLEMYMPNPSSRQCIYRTWLSLVHGTVCCLFCTKLFPNLMLSYYIPRIRRIGGCYGFTSKPPAARNGVNAITQKPRDGLFSNLVYTLVVIVSWPD